MVIGNNYIGSPADIEWMRVAEHPRNKEFYNFKSGCGFLFLSCSSKGK